MSDLYETDILAWSEDQAARLRRVATAERLNEASPDWPNIIEEIESVGRSELRATESLLVQALRHRLKIMAWPDSSEVPPWQEKAAIFEMDAASAYQPSMRQHLDMARIYRKARHRFPQRVDGQPPRPLPEVCPVTLDELLAEA
jgi:uncharacterized protein DUF29